MEDVLYVPGIGGNLLSIMALDKKGFIVLFGDSYVRIIKSATGGIVAKGYARNSLYQLTESQSDTAFISRNLEDPDHETKSTKAVDSFRRLHQRMGHTGAHRLRDIHLHAKGVETIEPPKEFQCDVYNATKMTQKINKHPLPKETIPGTRIHTDFWGPYNIRSIVGGYR